MCLSIVQCLDLILAELSAQEMAEEGRQAELRPPTQYFQWLARTPLRDNVGLNQLDRPSFADPEGRMQSLFIEIERTSKHRLSVVRAYYKLAFPLDSKGKQRTRRPEMMKSAPLT